MPMVFAPDFRLSYFGSDTLGPDSIAIGTGAGASKRGQVAAANEVLIGYNAGRVVPAGLTFHTFVGYGVGGNATAGSGSVGIGQKALSETTTAHETTAVGSKVFSNLPNAQSDTGVGYGAGQFANATNLGRRTFVGYNAGQYENGDCAICIGYAAGRQGSVNSSAGEFNIAIGGLTLNAASAGDQNVVIGHQAGTAITSGFGNHLFGYQAGYNLTTGGNNVMIGAQSGFGHTSTTRCIFVGVNAGVSVPNGSQNVFVAGGTSNERIDNVFFGKGYADAAPTAYSINGTGGLGSNVAGADVRLAGGKGTGSASGGKAIIAVASAGNAGSSLNSLTDVVTVDPATQKVRSEWPLEFKPGTSLTPTNNGDVVFEFTSNTTLTIKARGSDGVTRSAAIMLA